jgi:hypothetical protein
MLLRYLGRDANTYPESLFARETSAFVGGLPVAFVHIAGQVSFSDMELMETFRNGGSARGTDDHARIVSMPI